MTGTVNRSTLQTDFKTLTRHRLQMVSHSHRHSFAILDIPVFSIRVLGWFLISITDIHTINNADLDQGISIIMLRQIGYCSKLIFFEKTHQVSGLWLLYPSGESDLFVSRFTRSIIRPTFNEDTCVSEK